ncbi:MAG: EAL domain-containing protein [Xanthobacteraceae bacterium]|jgi:diguanylate cyclase (GGDEF)-like protein/PAS domain S-box-containing protein
MSDVPDGGSPRDRDQMFRLLVQSLTDHAIYMLDPDGLVSNWNPGAERINGYAEAEIIGHHFSKFYKPEDIDAGEPARVLEVALREGRFEQEGWLVRKDGSQFWANVVVEPIRDGSGILIGFAKVTRDITERKEAAARIEYLAYHDSLTGLANRTLLADRLTRAIQYTERKGGSLAVLALDLDRFTMINDTFGHDKGDRVIALVAARLQHAVRAVDTVARVGGDEFMIMQIDVKHPADAAGLAQRLIGVVSQPFELEGQQIDIGISIGIALYPDDGLSAGALVQNADTALYSAKAEGGSVFRFFEAEMTERIRARLALQSDLRRAIGTEQIKLVFQPQFTCSTGALVGFEVLLRWDHPTLGEIMPTRFIPIAEDTGLIVPLGRWVLEQACTMATSWAMPIRVAVNLSPVQFRGPQLPVEIQDILRRSGLPPDRLELEVTETLLTNTVMALGILRRLRDAGVHITLDDFGTGYSSLNHVRSFPFEKLKIDKSFVQNMGTDPKALSLIRTILALAANVGLTVVAEGVETAQQLEILRGLQCGEVQGFLLGTPIPAEQVGEYIKSR